MLSDIPIRAMIAVADIDRGKAFYRDKLGLTAEREDEGGTTFSCGGGTSLLVYASQFAGTAKSTAAGFEVKDLDAEVATLRERGVAFEDYDFPGLKTENGIATIGPGRAAWFKDPDGNILALFENA